MNNHLKLVRNDDVLNRLNGNLKSFGIIVDNNRNTILISFEKKLRLARLTKGFTQEQLANELGIEISQISRIDRGVVNTSFSTLYSISKVLNVDLSEFFVFD